MLSKKGFLTLDDLQATRMGFTLYEGETCNGIQLEAASVTAAMRVTGKAIAPKKLMAWLDSIDEDVPGRYFLSFFSLPLSPSFPLYSLFSNSRPSRFRWTFCAEDCAVVGQVFLFLFFKLFIHIITDCNYMNF